MAFTKPGGYYGRDSRESAKVLFNGQKQITNNLMSRKRNAAQSENGKRGTDDQCKDTNKYINNKPAGFALWDEAAILRGALGYLCLFRYHSDTGAVEVLKLPAPREKRKYPVKYVKWCHETGQRKAFVMSISDMTVEEYVKDFAARKQGKKSPVNVVQTPAEEILQKEREARAWMN